MIWKIEKWKVIKLKIRKNKELCKMRIDLGYSGAPSEVITFVL